MSQESKMLTPATYVTTPDGWGHAQGVWDRASIENYFSVQFQNGPVQTRGVNGVQLGDVLKVCRDQAAALNRRGVAPSRERSMMLQHLDEAMLWEKERAEKENTREKAVDRAAGRGA